MRLELDITTPWFHPCVGGVEYRVMEIATRLAKRGHTICVHTTAAKPDGTPLTPGEEELRGLTVVRYAPERFEGAYRLFWKPRIRGSGPIEGHGYPNLVTDWVARQHAGKRGLTTELIGSTLYPTKPWHRLLRLAYDRFKGIPTLKRMDLIQTMTRDEIAWCRSHGIRNRAEEIPNGVEDAAFATYDPKPVRARYGLDRYVLQVGRLYREKNPRDLVRAFARLAAKHPDLKLCFVGPDQGETAPTRALAKELGVEKRVVITGSVPTEEKYALIKGSEFLALPSDFEAQGIVLIEGWAQGKTCVASRVGGVPYIVKDGVTGLLHERGDIEGLTGQMERLLADTELRRRFESQAKEEARERYRWDAIIPRLEALYGELAERPRQP